MGDKILRQSNRGLNKLNRPAFIRYRAHSGVLSERRVIVYEIGIRAKTGAPLCLAHCRESGARLTFNARNILLLKDESTGEQWTDPDYIAGWFLTLYQEQTSGTKS